MAGSSFGFYDKMSFFVCELLVLMSIASTVYVKGVSVGFYATTCPQAELIVTSTVQSHLMSDRSLAAALLRLHFHDCFVQGCDGSVLLDGTDAEKIAITNTGLRGFDVIEDAKQKIELVCPGVVSCADILALAARDAVVLSGGVRWLVPTGRRDGLVSRSSDAENLPTPRDSVDLLKQKFANQGLTADDLVILSGAHTIGSTSCAFVVDRLYNFNGIAGGADPSINPLFLPILRGLCPQNGNPLKRIPLDFVSHGRFDTTFYSNLRVGRGVLKSDQELYADASTKAVVEKLLGLRGMLGWTFNVEFGKSMVKLSQIGVKTGTEGEIRNQCSVVN